MQQQIANRFTLSLFTVGILMSVVGIGGSAQAQTTSVGPYYATPSWDQTLPASTRFVILSNFKGEAVLDRNTGLVWEKSPDPTTFVNWFGAITTCFMKTVGGQRGWRLPNAAELESLIDPSVPLPGPALMAGHPFVGVAADGFPFYWSSVQLTATNSLMVSFADGRIEEFARPVLSRAWCVRGGSSAGAY